MSKRPIQTKLSLPIQDVLPALCNAFANHHNAVLSAPPGAGKTTQVPLCLLEQPWCTGKIIMFEPRRMAARAAATRMAQLLGEPVGNTVGYRIRGESRVNPHTRIEVVTGGILTRMLVDNPGLENYSAVILDEFHERNLDADLSLALTLSARELFRTLPLRLLVMSATLDANAVVGLLNNAPLIVSKGKMHPVETLYTGSIHKDALSKTLVSTTLAAHHEHSGHILVFLPGQREIHAVKASLDKHIKNTTCAIPLYGSMSLEQQQSALSPLPASSPFTQKIVLATDIAETSLTIDGVTVVIDGGYHRAPVFDPRTSMTRLDTRRISSAQATQRTGRAGRTAPGTCYRLWSKETPLSPQAEAEISQADLAPLALLLCGFGIRNPSELSWLTPPPDNAYKHALQLLNDLGALDPSTQSLTAHGEQLMRAPTHPRLAHMMLLGKDLGVSERAATLAALLSESHSLNQNDDLEHTLEHVLQTKKLPQNIASAKRQLLNWLPESCGRAKSQAKHCTALLLGAAYPDRIAQQTSTAHIYRLSNGRQARIRQHSPLQNNPWLAVADLGGQIGKTDDTIYSAAAISVEDIRTHLGHLIITKETAQWSEAHNRFVAERVEYLGVNELSNTPIKSYPKELKAAAALDYINRKNLDVLPWQEASEALCARVQCLRHGHIKTLEPLPDMSRAGLLQTTDQWLEPYLSHVTSMADIKKLDLTSALATLLPWPLPKQLDELAPSHFEVPSGSRIKLNYNHSPPVLAVKLQELFGCKTTPAIARGEIPLTVHLLSPAGRPLQITQDLAGFWQTSYIEVKKEMKGRYPKHPWPDDPANARATRFTKKRAQQNN